MGGGKTYQSLHLGERQRRGLCGKVEKKGNSDRGIIWRVDDPPKQEGVGENRLTKSKKNGGKKEEGLSHNQGGEGGGVRKKKTIL